MRKFLSCGLIAIAILQTAPKVCAEPPSGTPVMGMSANPSAPNFSQIQKLIKDNPAIIDRIKTLIEQNPDLVVSIVKSTLAQSPKLIQQINSNPHLAQTIISSNPQLVQTLLTHPQVLNRLQSMVTSGK